MPRAERLRPRAACRVARGARSRIALAATVALIIAASGAAILCPPGADAGQVRVSLSGTLFSPRVVDMNLGDHAVWIWISGVHSVVSGDSSQVQPDGLFSSGFPTNNVRFSWKSTQAGNIAYYCEPHAPGMAGRVVVHNTQPRIPVADFRITEVQFNVAGGQDLIEISNLGEATGNLAYFRIATTTALPLVLPTLPNPGANDLLVPPGGRVVVHLNASSVNTATDLYIASFSPGTGLPDANGSLALYVPSSQAPANASSNANLMIDFVQWGAAGQPNETTANIAGFWTAGTSINGVAAGHSIEYCANATLDHGVARWAEIATPTFGGNGDCATPTASDTWGRLKTLYRN